MHKFILLSAWIFLAIIYITCLDFAEGSTTAAPEVNCTSVPPPCHDTSYCRMVSGTAMCFPCDPACMGCKGFGSTECIQCKPGYRNITGSCFECPSNTFGVECAGTCHCQLGPEDCNRVNGHCQSFVCAIGYTGAPECQDPCKNDTFGYNCEFKCHCPPGDKCAIQNGLCPSGSCGDGWSGAGCQNELAQLENPPEVENVTCANVTITWFPWRRFIDKGNPERTIERYELFYAYKTASTNETAWILSGTIPYTAQTEAHQVTLTSLVPDADYRFRVDVRQKTQDGGKVEQNILTGKPSAYVNIPCTEPTTPVTTTPIPVTTPRPPGPGIIDESRFRLLFLNDTTIMVEWGVYSNTSNFVLNLTLKYYEAGIQECPPYPDPNITEIDVQPDGNFNITNVLPWRQYVINVTATSFGFNVSHSVVRFLDSPEHAPTGEITNIKISGINKNGGQVTWSQLPCFERGGVLLYYRIMVYIVGTPLVEAFTATTNETSFYLDSLAPYTPYRLSVVYVNSIGAGPAPTNMFDFTTLEDVPGPPSITLVTSDQTSLTVNLAPPSVTNGILLAHSISVSEDQTFANFLTKSQNVDQGTAIRMENLSPDTLYYIKAQSSTSVGFGSFSSVASFATKPSTPPPPTNTTVVPGTRNETCVELSWQPPVTIAGVPLGYNITYQEVGSEKLHRLFTNETSLLVCDLDPGSIYLFRVYATNDAGLGIPSEIRVSTEQTDPPVPPLPEILNVTSTYISVALDPVVMVSSAISYGYLLFIHDVQGRKKRATSSSTTTCPGVNEVPGYIARNFSQSEITSRIQFIIGDGNSYGPFNNTALTESHMYDIYYVISSYFEGLCKYNFVKTKQPIKAVNPPPPVVISREDSDSSNTGLIIALVVIILVIIIVIVVIIIVCIIRRRRGQPYEPYMNEKDGFGLKVWSIDDYDPLKWWNTIYSLRESRYITVGRDYLPDGGHQFANGDVKVTGSGSPVTFNDEFSSLPHARQSSANVANRRENELKNRFSHLLPYDHSRVILEPDESGDGDYINANFIKGYKHQRAYIAAQSPFDDETVLDFWRMIYQYEVNVIVMMSNLVEDNIVKCTQYWPNSGRVLYGQFILDLIDEQEYSDYVIRTIHLRTKLDTEWQVVRIFELTYWPEHGVPDDPIPLLEMRHKVNVYHSGQKTPIVVHCGTGVSRTGVYIALDSLLEQYVAEGRISIVSFVRKLRKDRPAMVRTLKQYVFIYEAIFEAMVAGLTRVGTEEFKERYQVLTEKNPINGHSFLHCQFRSLQNFTRKLYPSVCSNALLPANEDKNRFCEIIPPDIFRPILVTPGGIGRTDYINAVFLDSHRCRNHFLITQTPLHTTVIDFWKLVYDHDVHTIVMMEPMTYDDDTSAVYWPDDNMKQYEPFFVETTNVYQQENITIRNLKIVSMQNPKNPHLVRQFQFNAWSDSEFIPKSKSMLLDVIDLVNSWQVSTSNDMTPILVHCKDGATHSGLYIAVSILCEKVLEDGEVDIYHTVRRLKRRRNQIVDMLDQYRFCYKALWDFINMRMPNGTLTSQMSRTRADIPYQSLSLSSYATGHEYMPY